MKSARRLNQRPYQASSKPSPVAQSLYCSATRTASARERAKLLKRGPHMEFHSLRRHTVVNADLRVPPSGDEQP